MQIDLTRKPDQERVRRLVRRMILTVFAAALLSAAPTAARADAPDAWQHKALSLAQRVWHPACGQLTVAFGQAPSQLDDSQLADVVGWAYIGQCPIYISKTWSWSGYPEFCEIVLHEAGHAAGLPDSDRGIMNAASLIIRNVSTWRSHGRVYHEVEWGGIDRRCLPTESHT